MGTTTEPPYLHKSAGVAARNGTTTHTITFTTDGDAPFTPATGSLLVFFIFGAVTHTNSGGWTERFQPVNTGELSLFEITSAPTTSITITHNGSNYPAPWVVYELPAGTTYVSGVQAPALAGGANTTDTFPTLSGLTGGAGNERLILAAKGRALTTTNSTQTASSVWAGSYVEDCELNIAHVSGTEGAYLTSAHLINLTATSTTPSCTTTWTIDASWAPDREYVVAAYNAIAPSTTTPFSKDVVERYRVYNAISKDVVERYRVTNTWTKDVAETYRVLNAISKDVVERYRVYGAFSKDVAETYRILGAFSKDVIERYRVLGAFSKDVVETYRVLGAFSKDVIERYRITNGFTKDVAESYSILSGVAFSKDVVERYRVLNGWTKDVAESYRVYNAISKDVIERYRIYAALTKDVVERYRITNAFSLDVAERYTVLSGTQFAKDVVERYRIYNPITADVVERYRILAPLTRDVVERYRVLGTLSKDVVERYRLYGGWSTDVIERYRIISSIIPAPLPENGRAYLGPALATADLGPLNTTAVLLPIAATAYLDRID